MAKKQETRQRISDEATALFLAHGFEAVTVEHVAAAAQVSRMTVFNYFPRKEDLMLDRQDELKMASFREAIRTRPDGQSPVDALRALMAQFRLQGHPFVRVDRHTVEWWRFASNSPALRARLRELYDEAADGLALELGGPAPDGRARLAAGVIVLTVRTARDESVLAIDRGASDVEATEAFLAVFGRGFDAAERLTEGRSTPGRTD